MFYSAMKLMVYYLTKKKKSQTKRERIIDHAPRWIWKGFFSLRRSYICMLDLALDEQPFIMIGVIAAPQPYIPRAVGIKGTMGHLEAKP